SISRSAAGAPRPAPPPRGAPAAAWTRWAGAPGAGGGRAGPRVRLTQGAKKALEQSLRIAVGRKDDHIATLHLLLALLSRPGTVSEALADHGVTYASAEAALAA
ncbi:Clp protease N-terminal domain-containing protein, partial [Streptomyces sp. NPDC048551]|uniref:Clp protease N-terminal domain-containing protein n=1 Tax=Streptomyces sp. NPDC048551 TaxID=3155758 RepID=UPI0034481BA7